MRFRLKPGGGPGLVDAFRHHGILEASLATPGCLDAQLCVSADGAEAIATALWHDRDAYRGWTNRSDKGEHRDIFNLFLAEPITDQTAATIYDVHLAPSD